MSLRKYPRAVLEDRLAQYRFDLEYMRRHAPQSDSVEDASLRRLIERFEDELRFRDLVEAIGALPAPAPGAAAAPPPDEAAMTAEMIALLARVEAHLLGCLEARGARGRAGVEV